MRRNLRDKKNFRSIVLLLVLLLAGTIVASSSMGSTNIDLGDVYKIILNRLTGREFYEATWVKTTEAIIWEIRIPRILLGVICGGGLAICGVLMQCITRNPIADPYILGISSGASTGAVFMIVAGGAGFGITSIMGGAFTGAVICGIIVFILGTQGGKNGSTTRLILTGIGISTIFSAITNLLIYSARNSNQVKSAIFWSLGSLGKAKWDNLLLPFLVLTVVFILAVFMWKTLDILIVGDASAVILGVDTKLIKSMIILLTTLLTAILVSLIGAIGFIGLVIPHISRGFYGSSHREVLVISLLLGGILLVWCDVVGRVAFAPREIPIGIVTSLIGGPFFLWRICFSSYSFGGSR